MEIIDDIKSKINNYTNKRKEKKLIKKFKDMNDEQLEEYIIDKSENLEQDNFEDISEQEEKELEELENVCNVARAIKNMDDTEKQLQLTEELSDILPDSAKGEILKNVDKPALILKNESIKDIIHDMEEKQKYDIVSRILNNQINKIPNASLREISKSIDDISEFVGVTADYPMLSYIECVNSRLHELKKQDEKQDCIRKNQIKLIRLSANKVVSNLKKHGYSMRITEFMNSAMPMEENIKNTDKDNMKEKNKEIIAKKKQYFLKFVENEGKKKGMPEAGKKIKELLEKEEENFKNGEISKIERDVGKKAFEKIKYRAREDVKEKISKENNIQNDMEERD